MTAEQQGSDAGAGVLPRWQRDLLTIVVALVGVIVLYGGLGLLAGMKQSAIFGEISTILLLATAYGLVVLALNLQWGYTGLFNIGVAGFMAVGAYTMAITTADPNPASEFATPGLGLPVPVGIVLGILAAAVVGLVVIVPALRIRADYFAIVTLAFAESIRLLITSGSLNEFSVAGRELGTGGGAGMSFPAIQSLIPELLLYQGGDPTNGANLLGYQILSVTNSLGIDRGSVEDWLYTLVLVAVVGLVFWLLVRTGNSPFGRLLKAIREDELAAKSLGKDTNLVKVKVFVLGCALMGLAGILLQGRNGYVDPTPFLPITTFYIFIALIIGGSGSNTGSIVGALAFVALLYRGPDYLKGIVTDLVNLPEPNTVADAVATADPAAMAGYVMAEMASVKFIVFGITLVLLMIYLPDGILGHRNEPASPIDLRQQRPPSHGATPEPTEGGETDD